MKALHVRELFWQISGGDDDEQFAITAYDSEQEMFDYASAARPAQAIDLRQLLTKSDPEEARWTRRPVSAREAGSFGVELWNAIPEAVSERLRSGQPIRLKVATDVPGVADLPWEWLTDGNDPPFALRPGVLVVRAAPLRFPIHPLSVEKLRLLLVVPNPKDERFLFGPAEIDAVCGDLPDGGYELSVLDEPELVHVLHALATFEPHILHYIGHAGLSHGEGNLILQDGGGRSHWLTARKLATYLPSSVRLLCLSTPFTVENYQVVGLSRFARAAGVTGLPTTIANQYPVDGTTVASFWRTFYARLLDNGGDVGLAVHEARRDAATLDGTSAGWASFSLVIRDQTGVSFELRPGVDDPERRATELQAQFAAEAANELADQLQLLGEETPDGLKRQFAVEERRVTGLLEELSE